MKRPYIYFSLLSLCFLFASNGELISQDNEIRLRSIELPVFLTAGTTQCMLEDSYGYLWIGNYAGLHRYDGYEIETYTNNKLDSLSIGDNKVNAIAEDHLKNFWVGTQNGLYYFNRQKETFTQVLVGKEAKGKPYVSNIKIDHLKRIWVNSFNGIHVFNSKKIEEKKYLKDDKEISQTIFEIIHDKNQNTWLLGYPNIYRINKRNGIPVGFNVSEQVKEKELKFNDKEVNSISSYLYNEHKNIFLLGTNIKTLGFSLTEGSYFVPQNIPDSLVVGVNHSDDEVLFHDVQGDIFKYNLNTFAFDKLKIVSSVDLNNERSKEKKFFTTTKNIFLQTLGNFFVLSKQNNRFKNILWSDDLSIVHSWVYNIFEFQKDEIIINTKFGPSVFNIKNRELFQLEPPKELSIDDWKKTEFHTMLDVENDLSIFGTNSGVFYFDKKTKQLEFLNNKIDGLEKIKGKYITGMCMDDNGMLWIATWNSGTFKIDFENLECKSYLYNFEDKSLKRMGRSMILDKNKNLWIGTRGGLGKYVVVQDTFHFYTSSDTDPNSLSENTVFDIHEDSKGLFWIGTYGGGLDCFDPEKGEVIESYTKLHGLADNNVMNIMPDKSGNLWLKTFNGISRFNLDSKKIDTFSKEDGLLAEMQTVYNAGISPYTGEMFHKISLGLQIFHPDSITYSDFKPNLVFTDFKLSNKSVGINNSPMESNKDSFLLQKSINQLEELNLAYDQNVIGFEYAALDVSNTKKGEYAYQLEGFDNDWQYVGKSRSTTFTNLDPGQYVFKVKGTNKDGVWSPHEKSIKLNILPPWYMTWWSKILYGLIIGIIALAIYRYQKRRLELQAQLSFEKNEADRLLELDTLKTNLYTNITHEFRTPLTVILGLTDLIKEQIPGISEEKIKNYLNDIDRNGNGLLSLVNQMLDLSKLEAGKLNLHLQQSNIVQYLNYLFQSFESLAESKKIQLLFDSNVDSLVMDYDPERLAQIFNNLLSNAIKFTPEGGKVSVLLQKEASNNLFHLFVKDTGIGISQNNVKHVFDRFYQIEGSTTRKGEGTGIGLAFVKELANLMDGDIHLESQVGVGSSFKLSLPIKNQAQVVAANTTALEKNLPKVIKDSIQSPASLSDADGEVVLLVEDNTDVRNYLKACLVEKYQILEAENGEVGIAKALEVIPDLIISDVMMPIKDGFEVCETLKQHELTSHIPIIMLTAKADIDSKLAGLEFGADDYLAKPFHKKELLIRMKNLISIRKNLQERYKDFSRPIKSQDQKLKLEDEFVLKLKEAIETNIDLSNFGPTELANTVFLSKSQVHRKLKALTGKSTGQFIHQVRLFKAKEMLLETQNSATQIAFEVGYKELSYFSKLFTEEFGISPSEIRK